MKIIMPSVGGALFASILCGASLVGAEREDSQQPPSNEYTGSPVSLADWNATVHHAGFGFFNSSTGVRVAYLEVETLSREFGHAGPFVVAWKPQVVLDHVTIEITDAAAWPKAAGGVFGSLRSHHENSLVVIRNLVLRVPEWNGFVMEAPSARLTANGEIAFSGATAIQRGTAARVLAYAVVPLSRPLPSIFTDGAVATFVANR